MGSQILEDRFEIEKQLSHTDFITVYLVRDRHYLHRPHCIVKAVSYQQAKMRHRIEREVHTLERLGEHPQIPRVLAYFHAADPIEKDSSAQDEARTFYIAQDLINGHPLSQEILPGKPLSESYASKLLKDVLVPLASVHKQGVVHQSLHPQHLIRQAQDGQIFLTEFGMLPKLARSSLDEQGVLTSSVPVSPQPYSAPEQLLQNPQPASDLYALGLIAIEALTGRRHQDLEFDPVKGLVWRDLVTTGAGVDGKLSLSLAEFIDRMVRHRWEDRFANAEEALSLLRVVRDRNKIAQDSRYPTVIAAPGKRTAFGQSLSPTANPAAPQPPRTTAFKNNLPYPLNLAVRSQGHRPIPAGSPANRTSSGYRPSSSSPYTPQYATQKSNPYLFKLAIGSVATLLAVGVGVKTYQWGEYRLSRLPQSWSEWALKPSSGYKAADPATLTPLYAEGSDILLQPAAAKAYWQMSAAATADGVALYALSGYRPVTEVEDTAPSQIIDTQAAKEQANQEQADREQVANRAQTEPPAREIDYQTGYALDIGGASEATDRQLEFAKTDAYKWLSENAQRYGFELSSPAPPLSEFLGSASAQPWHWRYVGDEASQKIFGNASI